MPSGHPTAAATPNRLGAGARNVHRLRRPFRSFADSLTFKVNLVIGISALVLLTGAALILIAARGSRATSSDFATRLFHRASEHAVTQSRNFMDRAVPLVDSLARLGDSGLALNDSDRLARQLVALLPAHPRG